MRVLLVRNRLGMRAMPVHHAAGHAIGGAKGRVPR
jgi:hypothetical protein